jgi:hypothetical protein
MSSTIDQIEGQVREKVDSTVSQARQALDLRHQVSERPWVALGASLALGFVVGSMGGDSDQPRYPEQRGQPMRYYSTEGRPSEPRPPSPARSPNGDHEAYNDPMASAIAQIAGPVREELSLMATAAIRSAMRMFRESLQGSIPQFDSEYRAVQHERDDSQPSTRPADKANAVGAQQA